jgi:uncharacterized protein YegL
MLAQKVKKTSKKAPKTPKAPAKSTPLATKTRVAFVLDRSSSMGSCVDETIYGFNQQIDTIQKSDNAENTLVSLWTFSCHNKVKEVYVDQPVSHMQRLSKENYIPDGMTAMQDGVGDAITKLASLDDGDTAFLVLVISDGAENDSRRYDAEKLATLVKQKQDTGKWTFVYIGANQDLSKVSASTGILRGNMTNYNSSPIGTKQMYTRASAATAQYLCARDAGETSVMDYWNGNEDNDVDVNDDPLSLPNSISVPTVFSQPNWGPNVSQNNNHYSDAGDQRVQITPPQGNSSHYN